MDKNTQLNTVGFLYTTSGLGFTESTLEKIFIQTASTLIHSTPVRLYPTWEVGNILFSETGGPVHHYLHLSLTTRMFGPLRFLTVVFGLRFSPFFA